VGFRGESHPQQLQWLQLLLQVVALVLPLLLLLLLDQWAGRLPVGSLLASLLLTPPLCPAAQAVCLVAAAGGGPYLHWTACEPSCPLITAVLLSTQPGGRTCSSQHQQLQQQQLVLGQNLRCRAVVLLLLVV
jgi:hypothetical protein